MRTKIAALTLAATAAVGGGALIAPFADAHPIDTEEMEARLDEAVESGELTQEEADEISARVAERQADREARQAEREAERTELAESLGLTVDELRESLRDGQSLADLAAAAGVDVDALIADIVADKSARIDEALAEGRIDEARAAEMKAALEERVTARVNGERPERGEGFGGRGRGHRGGGFGFGDADDASDTDAGSDADASAGDGEG